MDRPLDGRSRVDNPEVEVQGCETRLWSKGGAVEGVGDSRYTLPRRGGRVVECGGLENRYVGNPGVGGSNPPLSAVRSEAEHAPAFGFRFRPFSRSASPLAALPSGITDLLRA